MHGIGRKALDRPAARREDRGPVVGIAIKGDEQGSKTAAARIGLAQRLTPGEIGECLRELSSEDRSSKPSFSRALRGGKVQTFFFFSVWKVQDNRRPLRELHFFRRFLLLLLLRKNAFSSSSSICSRRLHGSLLLLRARAARDAMPCPTRLR